MTKPCKVHGTNIPEPLRRYVATTMTDGSVTVRMIPTRPPRDRTPPDTTGDCTCGEMEIRIEAIYG